MWFYNIGFFHYNPRDSQLSEAVSSDKILALGWLTRLKSCFEGKMKFLSLSPKNWAPFCSDRNLHDIKIQIVESQTKAAPLMLQKYFSYLLQQSWTLAKIIHPIKIRTCCKY
jgi:hypothetical protein